MLLFGVSEWPFRILPPSFLEILICFDWWQEASYTTGNEVCSWQWLQQHQCGWATVSFQSVTFAFPTPSHMGSSTPPLTNERSRPANACSILHPESSGRAENQDWWFPHGMLRMHYRERMHIHTPELLAPHKCCSTHMQAALSLRKGSREGARDNISFSVATLVTAFSRSRSLHSVCVWVFVCVSSISFPPAGWWRNEPLATFRLHIPSAGSYGLNWVCFMSSRQHGWWVCAHCC